ncbi:class I SAM-dependent DNA methyltransferase, partial [Halorubrum sp. SS5]
PEVFFDADGERMPEAGFDTVIGNPPYVRIQELQTNVPERAEYLSRYRSSEQNFDLYVNFTEKGYELLSPRGLLGFIEPHKFFQNEFGRGIREFLADNDSLDKILSFGHKQVFGNASVYTCVLILSKYDEDGLEYAEVDPADLATGKDPNFRHINPELDGDAWVFQSPEVLEIIQEIEDNPLSLADATKKIYQGIITSADSIFLVETTEQMGDLTVVENGHGEQFKVESELLHPFLKGKDVKRYAPLNPPLQIILPYRVDDNELDFIPEESLRSEFPRAFEYFKSHESKLRSRDSGSMDTERWYDFTRAQNMGEFLNDKIVTPEISYGGNFTLDETGVLHKSKVYGIVSEENIDNEYLLT